MPSRSSPDDRICPSPRAERRARLAARWKAIRSRRRPRCSACRRSACGSSSRAASSPACPTARPACASSSSHGLPLPPSTSRADRTGQRRPRARGRSVALPGAAQRVPQPDRALRPGAARARRVAWRGGLAPLAGRSPRGALRPPAADVRVGDRPTRGRRRLERPPAPTCADGRAHPSAGGHRGTRR